MKSRRAKRIAQTIILLSLALWRQDSLSQEPVKLPIYELNSRVLVGQHSTLSDASSAGSIEARIVNGRLVKSGPVLIRYQDGKFVLSGLYRQGMPAGRWTLRSGEGVVLISQTYLLGKLDGISTTRDAQGRLIRTQSFRRGLPDGFLTMYNQRKEVTKKVNYKRGKVIDGSFTWKDKVVVLQDQRYHWRHDSRPILRSPKKLCHLSDLGQLICKTPTQVEHDLTTFLAPEIVSEILDTLEGAYDSLGLDSQKEVLTDCSGTFVATNLQPLSKPIQDSSKHRASLTTQESASIMHACGSASSAAITELVQRAPEPSTQRRNLVSQTKAQGDAMVAECRSSTAEQHVGLIPALAVALGVGLPEATAIAIAVGSAVVGATGYVLNEWFDDGWSDWEESAPNTEMRFKEADPSMKQYRNSEEGTTTTASSTPDGGRMEYTEHPDGSTTVKKFDKDGKLVSEDSYDEDGMPLGDSDTPPQGQPASPSTSQPGTPPAGGAGQPAPDAVTCENIAARWAAFKERCDQSDWRSYECEQYIRVSNRCPDARLINPGPDGDLTCQSKQPPKDMRRDACERRKMFERATPDSLGGCNLAGTDRVTGLLPADICQDPRAYCSLDAMVPDPARQRRSVASPVSAHSNWNRK